jgi:hypothetical protein
MVSPRGVTCFMFWAAFVYLCVIIMAVSWGPTLAAVAFCGFLSVRHARARWAVRKASDDLDEEYRKLIEDSRKR